MPRAWSASLCSVGLCLALGCNGDVSSTEQAHDPSSSMAGASASPTIDAGASGSGGQAGLAGTNAGAGAGAGGTMPPAGGTGSSDSGAELDAAIDASVDASEPPVEHVFNYQNPIRWNGDEELRDPCILREGDTYYLVFTVFPFTHHTSADPNLPDYNSSPGIKLYASIDLTHWTFVDWLVKSSELPESSPYKHRFWAPELHKIGDRFYLIFTADNWIADEYNIAGTKGGFAFVGVADEIAGPYEHITYIEGGPIDTSLFEASDGTTYAIMPRYEIDVQEIDLSRIDQDEVTLVGDAQRIIYASDSDVGIDRTANYLEGPFVARRGERYYAFFAANYDDGYWTGVAYADSPLGPWTKDPLGSQFFWGGHVAVFDGPDHRFWLSYRGEKFRDSWGRLGIDPVDMDDQGDLTPVGPTYEEPITITYFE